LATTPDAPNALETALGAVRLKVIARVNDSERATDLALALSPARLAIIRCVPQPSPRDHTALATMISEGPFIWGAVVYEQGKARQSPGLIESFQVSQLDRLVARLVELREALGEAG
jgi:hypothetical protein